MSLYWIRSLDDKSSLIEEEDTMRLIAGNYDGSCWVRQVNKLLIEYTRGLMSKAIVSLKISISGRNTAALRDINLQVEQGSLSV